MGATRSMTCIRRQLPTARTPEQKNPANSFAIRKSRSMPDTPEVRNQLRGELIDRELMFQEAKKAGFDKKPEVAAQAEAARQAVIIRAYVDDFVKKHPVTDVQLKSEYDTLRAKGGNTEYKSRHILVKTEEEARAIIAKLKKGEKFETLAGQSIDAGSRVHGGDLDWASPAKFVKPFADAPRDLKKGKYTETPVKSDFGYHVIRFDDSRPLKTPSFDEFHPLMQKEAQELQIRKLIEGPHATAKIN